jgi:predicted small lipoprotein YifL
MLMALPLFAACEKKGPLERAGEKVDSAFENLKPGGKTTGDKLDDAVNDVRNGVDDAADDLKKK